MIIIVFALLIGRVRNMCYSHNYTVFFKIVIIIHFIDHKFINGNWVFDLQRFENDFQQWLF